MYCTYCLQSESCRLNIPEIDLELATGTLGGRFTTVEGLLTQVYEELEGRSQFLTGDSGGSSEGKAKFDGFLGRLKGVGCWRLLAFRYWVIYFHLSLGSWRICISSYAGPPWSTRKLSSSKPIRTRCWSKHVFWGLRAYIWGERSLWIEWYRCGRLWKTWQLKIYDSLL